MEDRLRRMFLAAVAIGAAVALIGGASATQAAQTTKPYIAVQPAGTNSAYPLNTAIVLSGSVYIYVANPETIASMSYSLDNAPATTVANQSPFFFSPTGADVFDTGALAPGTHTLTALATLTSGQRGRVTTQFVTQQPTTTAVAPTAPQTTNASCTPEGIAALVNSVSTQNIEQLAINLSTTNGKPISRYVANPGNQEKVDWVTQTLTTYGATASQEPFTSPDGYDLNNVIGRLAGTNDQSFHMISAHIDSINDDDENGNVAPGANDDGSGIVVNMEVMRVLKAFQPCMKTSIEFAAFNDEENNFSGSEKYATGAKTRGYVGGWNMDPVGFKKGQPDCVTNTYNNAIDEPLTTLTAASHQKYGIDMPFNTEKYSGDDIDNVSFWGQKMPIAYLAECAEGGSMHSADDTVDNLNYSQMTKVAQILVGTLAEVSMSGGTTSSVAATANN